jgi:hypothetical protein
MLEKYIKFNLKLSPAYLVLAFIFIFGIVLTGDKETYVHDMKAVILQIMLLLFIPNVVYMIRHRKEQGSIIGLTAMLFIMPIPFILIAIIMRIIYV